MLQFFGAPPGRGGGGYTPLLMGASALASAAVAGYAGASLLGESMHVDQLKRVHDAEMGMERALRAESDAQAEVLQRVQSAEAREEHGRHDQRERELKAAHGQRERELLAEVRGGQAALRDQDVMRAELGMQQHSTAHLLERQREAEGARAVQVEATHQRQLATMQGLLTHHQREETLTRALAALTERGLHTDAANGRREASLREQQAELARRTALLDAQPQQHDALEALATEVRAAMAARRDEPRDGGTTVQALAAQVEALVHEVHAAAAQQQQLAAVAAPAGRAQAQQQSNALAEVLREQFRIREVLLENLLAYVQRLMGANEARSKRFREAMKASKAETRAAVSGLPANRLLQLAEARSAAETTALQSIIDGMRNDLHVLQARDVARQQQQRMVPQRLLRDVKSSLALQHLKPQQLLHLEDAKGYAAKRSGDDDGAAAARSKRPRAFQETQMANNDAANTRAVLRRAKNIDVGRLTDSVGTMSLAKEA